MSGGFPNMPDPESLESCARNPLVCFVCNEPYEDPCLMACCHTFCARCLHGRASEGQIPCPLCGKQTPLKEGSNLPPPDPLLRFLMDVAKDQQPSCANCEKSEKTRMYFCNTCGQALCGTCRDETHRAKMFSAHDIIHMSKHTKEVSKKCPQHGEQFIMFSTKQKSMMCINCFRETGQDFRSQCVDLDTAYNQGCKKLDRAMMSVRELRNSVHTGILQYKSLLEELRRNADSERSAITATCHNIQTALSKTHDNLLQEVDNQFEAKDRMFRSQLSSLGTLLLTIQVHLMVCTSFLSSASKYEFLELVYPLIERLGTLARMDYPVRPTVGSHIRTNYRTEIARTLEPWVTGRAWREGVGPRIGLGGGGEGSVVGPHIGDGLYHTMAVAKQTALSQLAARKQQSTHRQKMVDGDGPFPTHCRTFEGQYRECVQRLEKLKTEVQELHRDVKIRQCFAHSSRVEGIITDCVSLEETLQKQQADMERLRKTFDTSWEEQLNRVRMEQDVFQSQINDLVSLKSETKQLLAKAHQLETYMKSMASLMESISQIQSLDVGGDGSQGVVQVETGARPDGAQVLVSPSDEKGPFSKDSRDKEDGFAIATGAIRRSGRRDKKLQAPEVATEDVPEKEMKRSVLSQLIDRVRTKDDKKKSPMQEQQQQQAQKSFQEMRRERRAMTEPKILTVATDLARPTGSKSDEEKPPSGRISKVLRARSAGQLETGILKIQKDISGSRISSIYQSLARKSPAPPPPPPPPPPDVERFEPHLLESHMHLKEKLGRMMRFGAGGDMEDLSGKEQSTSEDEYQQIPARRSVVEIHHEPSASARSSPVRFLREDPLEYGFRSESAAAAVHPTKTSSCESLTLSSTSGGSQRSSVDFDRRSVISVRAGQRQPSASAVHAKQLKKQSSWESFLPLSGRPSSSSSLVVAVPGTSKSQQQQQQQQAQAQLSPRPYLHPDDFQGSFDVKPTPAIKKADSFEGHEEAVRTIVAAVQETRTLQRKMKQSSS